jgi:diaminopimelate decarboxylase
MTNNTQQETTNMFAHYYASKKTKFVIISESARPAGKQITVSSKAEARKVAKQHNAQAWNF